MRDLRLDIRPLLVVVAGLVAVLGLGVAMAASPHHASRAYGLSGAARHRLALAYGHLPLSFEQNRGQADRRVRFLTHGAGYSVGLTNTGALLSLSRKSSPAHAARAGKAAGRGHQQAPLISVRTLSVGFLGASPKVRLVAGSKLPGRVNYLIGNDQRRWHTNIPTFSAASYRAVWRGIDATFSGSQHQLEYVFTVAPGADPGQIRVGYRGQSALRLDPGGNLVVSAGAGRTVRQLAPHAYQLTGGQRRAVPSRYVLRGHRVTIGLGAYNHRLALVIDPTVTLAYSTYLGGSGTDVGNGIAVDASGSAYVTGLTASMDFPVQNPVQSMNHSGFNTAFVSKLNAAGSALLYSTFLGGTVSDQGSGIAVDSGGRAYVTGSTTSPDFPITQNAEQRKPAGDDSDAFVTKLDVDGAALLYSTYLGGTGRDVGNGIAVDSAGNAYVTGLTTSMDFPTTPGAYQPTYAGDSQAFVTKLNPAGSSLVYSTYLGGKSGSSFGFGTNDNGGSGIAVDFSGSAYVTGFTTSSDFPTKDAQKSALTGASSAFVTKLSGDGKALVYSTYLGGGDDQGSAIAVDVLGSAYVTGFTASDNFPVVNAEQPARGNLNDAFVTKLSGDGKTLLYSTYLGGNGNDQGAGIAVDSTGSAYVTGFTDSTDFPAVNAEQPANRGGMDAFVTKLSADGKALVYSTYLGGSNDDQGAGIAVDSTGSAYVIGSTSSLDFPAVNAKQPANGGSSDAFVAKLVPSGALPVTHTLSVAKAGSGSGSVTSRPIGIDCGAVCSASFADGTMVTLTATPAAGSTFTGFTGGGCSGAATTCTVTVTADMTVTATFSTAPPVQHTLTVSKAGSGSGSVSPDRA